MPSKILLLLNVGDPVPLKNPSGVFTTPLSHPELEGTLNLVHGASMKARNAVLRDLDVSVLGSIQEIVTLVKEMRDDLNPTTRGGNTE
jgi:hypothetical protein